MLDLDPTSPPHQHQAKRGQMTREWHATYYMVRDVHLPPLSLRGVYSPPLNTIPNSTRHAVTRKWHAGHQLFHYIYPGKFLEPWFGGFCTSKTVVWLIYAKKIKGRQMVFMAKGRQIGTRKKQLVYIYILYIYISFCLVGSLSTSIWQFSSLLDIWWTQKNGQNWKASSSKTSRHLYINELCV